MNYHGVYECLSVEGFLKAVEVARTLCALSADVRTLAAREVSAFHGSYGNAGLTIASQLDARDWFAHI